MLVTDYLNSAREAFSKLAEQHEIISQVGNTIAERARNGSRVFVMDRSDIILQELVNHPQGLMLFHSFVQRGDDMSAGDIFILGILNGSDEDDMKLVNTARETGAYIVVIGPQGETASLADKAIVNTSDPENGILVITGMEQKFGPVSGVTNAALAWCLAAETVSAFLKAGETPAINYGAYLVDGTEKYNEQRRLFLSRGY